MKKGNLLLTIVAATVLLLAACGTNATKENDKNTLFAIQDKGEITVGIMGTYAPYNFMNKEQAYDGFDVDIAKELAKRLEAEGYAGISAELGIDYKEEV